MSFPEGKDWYRIELSDGGMPALYLVVEVNSGGYGPIFADRVFTLSENPDGSLLIDNDQTFDSEDMRDGQRILVGDSFESANGSKYYFHFSYPEELGNLDQIFLDILKSVQIDK